eukprot:4812801-Pyramimonas_sp.AAC.1
MRCTSRGTQPRSIRAEDRHKTAQGRPGPATRRRGVLARPGGGPGGRTQRLNYAPNLGPARARPGDGVLVSAEVKSIRSVSPYGVFILSRAVALALHVVVTVRRLVALACPRPPQGKVQGP